MRNNLTNKILASACVIALAAGPIMSNPYSAFAATQGSLGATSTGSIDLKVRKDARVRISDLNDLERLNWEEGNGDVVLQDEICVYSSRAQGAYKINAQGSGVANAFHMVNGSNILPYGVKWNDGGAGSLAAPNVDLTAGQDSPAFQNASRGSINCANGKTAKIEVRVTAAEMTNAVDGDYTGTLTLIVSPA